MIKKNTYLVRVISSENEPRLEEISGKEWKQIVSANKNLPKEQKRYFMVSRIRTSERMKNRRRTGCWRRKTA